MANKYLEDLERQHRILDKKIDTATKTGNFEDLKLLKMKKARLALNDMIEQVKRVNDLDNE